MSRQRISKLIRALKAFRSQLLRNAFIVASNLDVLVSWDDGETEDTYRMRISKKFRRHPNVSLTLQVWTEYDGSLLDLKNPKVWVDLYPELLPLLVIGKTDINKLENAAKTVERAIAPLRGKGIENDIRYILFIVRPYHYKWVSSQLSYGFLTELDHYIQSLVSCHLNIAEQAELSSSPSVNNTASKTTQKCVPPEIPWEDNKPGFVPNSVAIKLVDPLGNLTVKKLGKYLKPGGPIPFMRDRKKKRGQVNIEACRKFFKHGKAKELEPDDIEGVEARKVTERALKERSK